MNSLDHFKKQFNGVGWFIPPYLTLGFLDKLAFLIKEMGSYFTQKELEQILAAVYSPEHLAAMVLERYSETPFIQDYKVTIAECVQAHFSGLNHIAVSGLMPVIEGAGKRIAKSRSINSDRSPAKVFVELAEDCKKESLEKNIGDVGQVFSMLDSFAEFAEKHLYINSKEYSLEDKTNRHGIVHGSYMDGDFGRPLNFYKSVAAIDFLCFISAFRAPISWMAPGPSPESQKLAKFYKRCRSFDLETNNV